MSALYSNWVQTMSDVQTTGCTIAVPDSTGPTAGLLNMSGYCFNTSAPPNPNCKPGGQPCQAQAACNVTNSYCCLPTPKGADPKFPLISYCSPQYNQTDYAGSIPDVVPNNWGRGGSRGWPGAPTWSSAFGKNPSSTPGMLIGPLATKKRLINKRFCFGSHHPWGPPPVRLRRGPG